MTHFKPGDKVNVTLTDATVTCVEADSDGTVEAINVEYEHDGETWTNRFPLAVNITIQRVAPEHWPPRSGQVWQTEDGSLWFATDHGNGQVTLVSTTNRRREPRELLADYPGAILRFDTWKDDLS